MPNNADMLGMLNNMDQINSLLAATGTSLPVNWQTMTPNDKTNFLTQLSQKAESAGQVAQTIDQNALRQKEMVNQMGQQGVQMQTDMAGILPAASTKKFNLKKAQAMPPQAMPQAVPQAQPEPQQDAQQDLKFNTNEDIKNFLEQYRQQPQDAINILSQYISPNQRMVDPNTEGLDPSQQQTGDPLDQLKGAVSNYYMAKDDAGKTEAALSVAEALPENVKPPTQTEEVPTQLETGVQPHVAKIIEESNKILKKLAEDHAKKMAGSKSFNLKKLAQSQTLQNVIMYGPGQTKVDAFTGQMISDWHLVERNKGFGLKIDDVQNIDFEAIWRGNIMDKFYSPYRDKDGNWVGGYIENRFEVDKNIPVLNNMQLKPGEKRKPYVPEYSLLEARLESSRKDLNKERGYAPSEKGKVFNWKEASKKKVSVKTASASPETDIEMENVAASSNSDDRNITTGTVDKDETTAQLKPLSAPKEPTLPGGSSLNTESTFICQSCKSGLSPTATSCPNCHFVGPAMRKDPKTGPDKPGRQNNDQYVQQGGLLPGHQPPTPYNARLSSVMTTADAIFFDGEHFIVYANKKKQRFDTFEDAEAFKVSQMLPQVPAVHSTPVAPAPPAPVAPPEAKRMPVKTKPTNTVDKKVQERHQSAHGLAIDG